MAMHVFNLTPTQQANGQQIYSGFYNYAIGQGSDSATATQFANIGLGVASGEGLGKGGSGWTPNADGNVTSVGPFQLNIQTGLGSQLNGDLSPANQIQVAASNMWGESGTGGTFNTQPWNAVGDTTGPGNGFGNDTYAGQSAAESIGARIASQNSFITPDGTPLAGGLGPTATPQQNPDGSVGGSGMQLSIADPNAGGSSGASGGGGTGGASGGDTGGASGGSTVGASGGSTVGASGGGTGSSAGGSATIPQAIDKQSAQMGQDTQAATKAATSISSSVVSAADKIAAIASATEKNLFSRGVMILVGALFIVGGLYMFGRATGVKMEGKILHA